MRSSSTSRSKVSLSVSMRSSSERSGLTSLKVLSSTSMMAWPSGTGISLSVIGWRSRPEPSLGDGVAAGGVAGGAPVVGGDRRRRCGAVRSPRRARAGRGRAGRRALLDRAPFALGGDRGRRLAGLCDLEAASGERVEQRGLAVVAACARAARSRAGRSARGGRAWSGGRRRSVLARVSGKTARPISDRVRVRRGRAARGSRSPRRRGGAAWRPRRAGRRGRSR